MNRKWYFNNDGVKVKPCARCKESLPYTIEYFPMKLNGVCQAYCWSCKKVLDKERSALARKTDKKWVKLPVVSRGDIPYKVCTSCRVEYPFTEDYYDSQKNGQFGLKSACKECRRDHNRAHLEKKWAWHLLHNAKGSAKRHKFALNIDEEYILDLFNKQGGRCYWLGIQLTPSSESKSLSQPSLDRLDRTQGYVKGNVVVCSFFANFGRNENSEEQWKQFLITMQPKLDYSQWA